ncbi:MAG: hypothetical protein CMJ72_15710 [Planctomycetaceae bacterium]|nr:hypothetical protein [Planctomycetaceae bacterium]
MQQTYQTKLAGLLAVLFLCAGCGDDGRPARYPVSGTLKSTDGSPLAHSTIMFRSVEGNLIARARVFPDASFQLTTFDKYDGAVAGTHRVQIMPFQNADGSFGIPLKRKYLKYDTSELEYEVSSEEDNQFDIVVELR